VQCALALFAVSFNDVGQRDLPGTVRFVHLRTRGYVIPTPIAAVEAVLGREVAILDDRVGWANAGAAASKLPSRPSQEACALLDSFRRAPA
jgi:hypothetical protein